ncbi:hypothetical protein [Roseobacter sp. MH60115]|uniref:hypothetical protein n=1 Tax=Roseobacter sp. MH60115 TaxID=2785324 RepID=UPI0018A27A14|nr:hypothetical protein [Roseobacter sp. MH60115]
MSDKKPMRVLFCINVQQTFFDLPFAEIGPVWKAFGAMMKGIDELPGVTILGMLDDDETMVGAVSTGSPYTAYIMADVPDRETVQAACNLFRTIPIGETDYRLWKYCTVEARMGRSLEVPADI